LNDYIFCGLIQNISPILIPLCNLNKSLDNLYTINLRARFIPLKLDKLKMNLIEEDDNINDQNGDKFISYKSRRGRERKLGEIIQKVNKWRNYFNGKEVNDQDKNKGNTLEEAAIKVGISKKSLDDYYNQLKYVYFI